MDVYGDRIITVVVGTQLLDNVQLQTTAVDVTISLSVLTSLLFIPSISGFNSNAIQLGFDQLLELPSHYLAIFIYWYIWAGSTGSSVVNTIATMVECEKYGHKTIEIIMYCTIPLYVLVLMVLIISLPFTRRWFQSEQPRYNAYKMILRVLDYARKNKRPVRPSAFVYCDRERPSRIDFAKERFGGPFISMDVEDVKTFLRVLLVLFAIGPVFVLEVPTSHSEFPVLAIHTGLNTSHNGYSNCDSKWMLLENGALANIVALLTPPVYIWIVYSVLRKHVPKIFARLGWTVVVYIMAVVSMLAVDLIGHAVLDGENKPNVMCMFVHSNHEHHNSLNLHWAVLILPNVLIGIASNLVMATSVEFISAQSPHSMKGVQIGMLFAVRGFYQLEGALFVVPFSLNFWKHGHLGSNPPVTSCGFGYFLLTIFIAVIGLVCFVVCARKYKYQVRDEEGFSQSQVEEVFERRLQHQEEQRRLPDSPTSEYDSMVLPDNDSESLSPNRNLQNSNPTFAQDRGREDQSMSYSTAYDLTQDWYNQSLQR